MSTNNPPSAAATARALEATQNLKRSVAAAFDGKHKSFHLLPSTSFSSLPECLKKACLAVSFPMSSFFPHTFVPPQFLRNHLDNGITPEHDDPIPNSPELDLSESETTEPTYLDLHYLKPQTYNFSLLTESSEARKMPPTNGYTSKVRVLDRYDVVGFISSGTYGRVYKAVGHNGMVGDFAIKKFVQGSIHLTLTVDLEII